MKWMLFALAVVGLAGCATYSDLKDRPADYSASTSKAPGEYLECVLPKWTDAYAGSHVINDGHAMSLVSPVGGGTPSVVAMTLSATRDAGSTHIEMRHMPSLNNFQAQWQQARSCL